MGKGRVHVRAYSRIRAPCLEDLSSPAQRGNDNGIEACALTPKRTNAYAMKQHPSALSYARNWLWLGVIALAVAGVFAVILVSARTPQLSMFKELFSVALVVHVDLSVLMWFLAVAGMGWALLLPQPCYKAWRAAGFWTTAAATALIALSPVDPHWEVVKSNYIPVLNNLPFLLGLGLLAAGLTVSTLPVMYHYARLSTRNAVPQDMRGFIYAAATVLMALLAFFLSAHFLPADLGTQVRFETLFWAGGHILQITFTLLMMAAWIALAEMLTGEKLHPRVVQLAYGISLLTALAHLASFVLYPFDSPEFIAYHTKVMIMLGGAGSSVLALLVIARLCAARTLFTRAVRAYASTLICSLVVFIFGGGLGIMISGQNVTIPAHYHGAIVGVTLALMGLAYAMLPRFGYPNVAATRLAFWQPIVYGIGQLMHVSGLAYSGGYGVLRKTAGAAIELEPNVKIALGFMGLGGLLAIIGGLLFVVVMIRAFMRRGSQTAPV